MKKYLKKITLFLLIILIIFCSGTLLKKKKFEMPLYSGFFTINAAAVSGICGDNLNWNFDGSTGVLTISGEGAMRDYGVSSDIPWYSYMYDIYEIIIQQNVTSIGNMAFFNLSSVKSITIPESVTNIGSWSFFNCTTLTDVYYAGNESQWNSISVGNNNNDLLNSSLYFNFNLKNIYGALTETGKCGSDITWEFYEETGTLYISGTGSMTEYRYTSDLPWDSYRSKIKNVIFSDTITSISDCAFYNCNNLTRVNLPKKLKSIGEFSFSDCINLTSIIIPDSVTKIEGKAFLDCISLQNIIIPDSVTQIGWYAFENTAYFNNLANWDNGILYIDNHLIVAKTNISGDCIVKYNTVSISDSAFAGCENLINITIPDTVINIGDRVFFSCKKLKNVTLPNNLNKIGNLCFYWCSSLSNIIIPNSVETIGTEAFYCSGLTSITIPNNVTNIDNRAFCDCYNLVKVSIGDSVVSIGDESFYYCNNLSELLLGNSLKSIGTRAFCYTNISELIVPDSVTTIGKVAFSNCKNLNSISLGSGIKNIGSEAFNNCTNLNTVHYNGGSKDWEKITIGQNNTYFLNASRHFAYHYINWIVDDVRTEYRIRVGDSFVTPKDPEKEYYTFIGWNIDIPMSMPEKDLTITAQFIPIIFYVHFVVDDELLEIVPYTVETIEINEPIIPSKIGYSGFWDDYELTPGNNITVNGYYTINSHTVTWCIDGELITDNYFYGDKIVTPYSPQKEGYTFIGWDNIIPETVPDTDLLFIAIWKINSYNIVWNIDGNTTIESYNYGEKIIQPHAPQKEGYTFVNWNNDIPNLMPAKNLEFIALWSINSHTVTWIVDGKKTIDNYCYGEKIIKHNTPIKVGYTFVGWDTQVPDSVPDYDLIFNATWEINMHTITWYTGENVVVDNYLYGEIIKQPSVEKEGFTFVGWDVQVPKTVPDNDLVFTAIWEINEYTITWNIDGYIVTDKYYYGQKIVLPQTPLKDGYIFVNWQNDVPEIMPARSLQFVANWKPKQYRAIFDSTIGSWQNGETQRIFLVDFGSQIIAPSAPSKPGYVFLGWALENVSLGNNLGIMDDFGKTFKAVWVASTDTFYTVETYKMNSIGEYVKSVQTFTGETDSTAKAFYNIENGFNLNEEKSILSGLIVADNSLVLKVYYDRNKYTFTTIVDGIESSTKYYYEAEVTAPKTPEKIGYSFVKWDNDIPAKMPANDVTINAEFIANSYNAIFNANGGAWSDGETIRTVATDYDCEIIAPENPVKQGYIFSCWTSEVGVMDDVNGKTFTAEWIASTETAYTVETYTMNTLGEYEKTVNTYVGTTDSTVNAEYTVKDGFTFNEEKSVTEGVVAADNSLVLKVYYDRNKYTFTTIVDGVESSAEYYYEAEVTAPETPEKIGYSFVNWDNDIPAKMPANDVTITAVWNVNSYSVKWIADGNTIRIESVNFGSSISPPTVPSKTEYAFKGWTPDVPETMPAYDLTFTAVFEKAYICPDCGKEILGEVAINDHIVAETKVTISSGVTVTSGELKPGATITVFAPQVDGKIFSRWIVDGATVSDADSSETTIVLGSGKISITAEYEDCSCKCHQGGIAGFFFKIVLFFQKLFGNNLECFCGKKH